MTAGEAGAEEYDERTEIAGDEGSDDAEMVGDENESLKHSNVPLFSSSSASLMLKSSSLDDSSSQSSGRAAGTGMTAGEARVVVEVAKGEDVDDDEDDTGVAVLSSVRVSSRIMRGEKPSSSPEE
jgi:hypothetical protein